MNLATSFAALDPRPAIARGADALAAQQAPDGSWQGSNDGGPHFTAIALALERAIGSLRPRDAAEGVRFLRAAQRCDGALEPWPTAGVGGHEATCFFLAGMRAAGVPASDPALVAAARFTDAGGGLQANLLIVRAVLAAAGVLDARTLPRIPLCHTLVPGHEALLGRLFGVNALVPLHVVPPLVRGLRDERPLAPALAALEQRRVVAYLSARQDQSGGFAGVPFYTLLMALVLRLNGVALADDRIARALAFQRATYVYGPTGLSAGVFHCAHWDTAHALRVLSGLRSQRERARRAAAYLVAAQSRSAAPDDWQTPPPDARRSGGWSFQAGNEHNPDIDSTAVVLSALAAEDAADGSELARAVDRGTEWLLSMQNADGGFAAFSHGKRSPPPGALFLPGPRRWLDRAERWLAEHGDPSTADVTGRVLHGLGPRVGRGDPRIERAIAFLRRHQLESGAWWGRWAINHLPATSYVITGLCAVGMHRDEPMLRRAVDWILGCQNADGGFGETPGSYADPELAGRGPSSVQVTGVVAWALSHAGRGRTPAVERAVRWLLERQLPDGSWGDSAPYGVIFPHRYYYRSDAFPTHLAMEALRAFAAA